MMSILNRTQSAERKLDTFMVIPIDIAVNLLWKRGKPKLSPLQRQGNYTASHAMMNRTLAMAVLVTASETGVTMAS